MIKPRLFILLFISQLILFNSCKEEEIPKTIPSVEIIQLIEISDTSFIGDYKITSNGNDEIIKKGVCWSTRRMPLIADNHTNEGIGTADFTSEIRGLIQTGVYYVRPYAVNNLGIAYGDITQFQTLAGDGKKVIDYDGNIYNTLVIADQTWLQENSSAKHFQNGDDVYPQTKSGFYDDDRLANLLSDENIKDAKSTNYYGETFIWDKVMDERNVCPTGWHPATDDDWRQLIQYLGGFDIAGGKLKETGTEHWLIPNTGATNESGFTALPSGYNQSVYVGVYAFWWGASEYDSLNALAYFLKYDSISIGPIYADKRIGMSVRCIKNNAEPSK